MNSKALGDVSCTCLNLFVLVFNINVTLLLNSPQLRFLKSNLLWC